MCLFIRFFVRLCCCRCCRFWSTQFVSSSYESVMMVRKRISKKHLNQNWPRLTQENLCRNFLSISLFLHSFILNRIYKKEHTKKDKCIIRYSNVNLRHYFDCSVDLFPPWFDFCRKISKENWWRHIVMSERTCISNTVLQMYSWLFWTWKFVPNNNNWAKSLNVKMKRHSFAH